MSSVKSIQTNINEPGLKNFSVSKFNHVFDIRFVIDSTGVPGYLVFKSKKDGPITIPIPADRVVAVVYADGTRTVSKIGQR